MRQGLCALGLVTLVLVGLPGLAVAGSLQPVNAQEQVTTSPGPVGGSIDLQPGAVNGQVTLERGSVSLQAALRDPGVDGQLQVAVPGQLLGSLTASDGQLNYDVTVCGAGVTFGLNGTSTNLHVNFHDASSNPTACSSTQSTARQPLVMRPLEAAQAEPSQTGADVQTFLANWVRRFIGFSLLALLLMLVIPAMHGALAVATETSPWARLGIGVAVLLILPLIGILIFVIGLPLGLWWLGVILLALYPVVLLVSMSVAGLALGSWLSRRATRPGIPLVVLYALGILVLAFASLLPYVGSIVTIVAVIFGLGTLVLAPRSRRPATTRGVEPPAATVTADAVSTTPVAA
ncbi:MAG: hypothetical protein JOZ87_18275 [Chloroflexi bacterium]|nr:hypothetical protein [Chloroflexota bacterium]